MFNVFILGVNVSYIYVSHNILSPHYASKTFSSLQLNSFIPLLLTHLLIISLHPLSLHFPSSIFSFSFTHIFLISLYPTNPHFRSLTFSSFSCSPTYFLLISLTCFSSFSFTYFVLGSFHPISPHFFSSTLSKFIYTHFLLT